MRNGSAEQLAYYRAVADEYEDHAIDVLELACGSGVWTGDSCVRRSP